MNRTQRRAEQKQARRQIRTARGLLQSKPSLYQVHMVFRPVDKFLEQLATGFIDVDTKGRAIFEDDDGECFEAIPAVRGFVCTFALLLKEHGMSIDMAPITQMCNRLEAHMPITPEQVRQCQGVIDRCRAAFRFMDLTLVGSLVQTSRIRITLENMES